MRLLISRAARGVIEKVGAETYRDQLGMLMIPRGGYNLQPVLDLGGVWAADNEAFSNFNRDRFIGMLKKYRGAPNCLFVSAPDVVADASATLLRFRLWEPVLRYYGYPVALVAQDGLETLPVPWERFEALFVGGSTTWKMGMAAARLIQEAKSRGKWVHVGRVNTHRRLRYFASMADSVDGTNYSKFMNASLQNALPMLDNVQMPLMEGHIW